MHIVQRIPTSGLVFCTQRVTELSAFINLKTINPPNLYLLYPLTEKLFLASILPTVDSINNAYLERAHKGFVNTHHCTCVIKLATVVWGRKQCYQLPFGKKFIAIFYHLKVEEKRLTLSSTLTSIPKLG